MRQLNPENYVKTKRNLIQIYLLCAALLPAVTPWSSAQTIQNPGFETPVVGPVGNYYSYEYNPTGAAWTFNGNAGIAANGSGFAYYNAGTPDGNQFAFLQGTDGVGGSMFQTISNFPAGNYSFTFIASQRDIVGRDNSQNQTVTVLVDGARVGSFTTSVNPSMPCQFFALELPSVTATNLAVSEIAASSAMVLWSTSEPATGQVTYWLEEGAGITNMEAQSGYSISHSITLTGLNSLEVYSYYVSGYDQDGNAYQSSTNTFRTMR